MTNRCTDVRLEKQGALNDCDNYQTTRNTLDML